MRCGCATNSLRLVATLAVVTSLTFLTQPLRVFLPALVPLAPSQLEAHLKCPTPSLATESLAPLAAGTRRTRRLVQSELLTFWRKRYGKLRQLPRIQIVNGTLYVSCPLSGDACASVSHELRTLGLLLRTSRVADVDFFFDASERPCHVGLSGRGRRPRPTSSVPPATRGSAPGVHVPRVHVPVVTHETSDGCENVLAPPRALKALPDGARWLARTDGGRGSDFEHWASHRSKHTAAVWRGGAADRGRTFDQATGAPLSVRAKAVAFSSLHPELLDARFAGRNDDLQLRPAERERVRKLGWGANGSGFLTWQEVEEYPAALVLDGNTLPDRLPFMLFSRTAVLKQASPLREAWYRELRPYVHYIPVAHDLSDLGSQLHWALRNASRLHAIANNAAELASRWLSRNAQLCHWSEMLRGLSRFTHHPVTPDPTARRVHDYGPVLLGGAVLHDPIGTEPATLRPQLTHRPPWLSDLRALWRLRLRPCVDLTRTHLCLDV